MKTNLILSILCIVGFSLNAQHNVLIRGGYNYSIFYENDNSSDYRYGPPKYDNKPAYYIGISYFKDKGHIVQFEFSGDLTAKHILYAFTNGGIGSWSGVDYDYRLYYADFSFYPVIGFGKRFRIAGSLRPNIGIVVYSHAKGTKFYDNLNATPAVTTEVNGTSRNSTFSFTFDIEYNLRFEYKLNEKIRFLIEGQYSHSWFNSSWFNEPRFGCDGYMAGTGIRITL